MNGLPILAHNHSFFVAVTTGAVSAPTSVASGAGLVQSVAGHVTTVTVQAKDQYGNNRSASDMLAVSFEFASNKSTVVYGVTTSVKDRGRGLYLIQYTLETAAVYVFHILANAADIYQSPFMLTIVPAEANTSSTTALVEPAYLTAGVDFQAVIFPRDAFGNAVSLPFLGMLQLSDEWKKFQSPFTVLNTSAVQVTLRPTRAQV